MKHHPLFRLILSALSIIVVLALVRTIIPNETHFTLFPEGFGKTHFIQGVTEYPAIQPKKKKKKQQNQIQSIQVFFCPSPNVCEKLCSLITNENHQIKIAIYAITDTKITQALIDAKKRGVDIELITDRSSALDRFTKIGKLHTHNISILLYQPPLVHDAQKGLMHNKFALFFNNEGKKIVWHGSFNFTGAGYKHNCESVLILEDHATFNHFLKEFDRIKKQSIVYNPTVQN